MNMQVPGLRYSLWGLSAVVLLLPLLSQSYEHSISQVLFCQPGQPNLGLLKMFDEDQMFSYNFTSESTIPRIQQFGNWTGQAFPQTADIISHQIMCSTFLKKFTEQLENIIPENRGVTHVTVFTEHPLRIGKPNTLICFIIDVFPPALTITWRKNGMILSSEVNTYGYTGLDDGTFQAFAYLNVTPHYNDEFSCDVQVAGDTRTTVAYWVPDYPVPSEMLENALCGLGFALGLLFLLLGFVFLYLGWKLRNID